MKVEKHLREVVWGGQLSWCTGNHGQAYSELRAKEQIHVHGEFAVGVRRNHYISQNPGNTWGPGICYWHFSVSDGVRAYQSKNHWTECMPSVISASRIDDDTVVVEIVGREIISGDWDAPEKTGKMLTRVACKAK